MDKSFDDYLLSVAATEVAVTYWPFGHWSGRQFYILDFSNHAFRLKYGFKGVFLQLTL